MKKMILKKHPFTILEILVAMGLLSVIMYSLLSILDQSQKAMSIGVSLMSVTEDARVVLDQIENDITCIDYQNAILKDKRPSDDPMTYALSQVLDCSSSDDSSDFTIMTSRPGKLSQFCKVRYFKSGFELIMEVQVYDEANLTWGPKSRQILLDNVMDFNVSFTRYDVSGMPEFPQQVTIELQLLDEETRKLGYDDYESAKAKNIDLNRIRAKIGADALQARYIRFTRVVSLQPPEL